MWNSVREEIDPTIAAVAAMLIILSLFLLFVAEVLRRRGRQSGSEVPDGLMR
jgi:ABC-type spermidine/putrescine transport system permease subunit II